MKSLVLSLALMFSSAHAAEVMVTWDANPAVENVTEYVVYVDDAEASRTGATLAAVDVAPGAHVFEVSAVNQWGESARSDPVSTPPASSAPGVVVVVVPPVTVSVTVPVP